MRLNKNQNIFGAGETPQSSQEVLSRLYNMLQSLGEKAPKYLENLSKKLANPDLSDGTDPDTEEGGIQKRFDRHYETHGRQYKKPAVNFNRDIDNRRKRREAVTAYLDLNKDDSDNDHAQEDVSSYSFILYVLSYQIIPILVCFNNVLINIKHSAELAG